ncbi:MAG: hypothetical protein QM813_25640 [Verrucomicrobiota bacterium]
MGSSNKTSKQTKLRSGATYSAPDGAWRFAKRVLPRFRSERSYYTIQSTIIIPSTGLEEFQRLIAEMVKTEKALPAPRLKARHVTARAGVQRRPGLRPDKISPP